VRFAILCVKEVCADLPWNAWADGWLSGEDRSEAAAYRSARAARAARAAAYRSARAAWAAREVGHDGIDIFEIAEKACSGLR